MKNDSHPCRARIGSPLFVVALLVTVAVPTAVADFVVVGTDEDVSCRQSDPDCVAAVSIEGDARCEKATCVAVSAVGDAESGCWGDGCMDCDDESCGPTMCSNNPDDFAPVCLAFAASLRGEASSGTLCRSFLQTCYAVAVSPQRTIVYVCYGSGGTDYECSGIWE